ncbi:short-chain dehydrogenase reductase family [Fusarium phyllophilum]|uniref:Short-chain dehydrogenase reductase family n=1 Tax=Fusarium phyllophilum TaxID=47803 RepID=A0A8H5NC98_9HYPO|nr:short-chain dehydrogenase reductase family [Fusarium phyllophilum]
MSANLRHQAASETTSFAFIWRQLFQSVPSIPNTVDLSGQVALITGSNVGLGFESARQFLALNLSHLILAVRSTQRGDAAAKELQAEFPSAKIEVWLVYMSSYDSIMAFAKQCETLPRLDIAILNAGLSQLTYTRAEETGHEITFQVNYLSTALLALVLIPILRENRGTTSPARSSLVGCDTSYYTNWKGTDSEPIVEAMDNPTSFDSWEACKTTKLLLLKFARELIWTCGALSAEEAVLYVASLVLGRTATVGARQYVDAVTVQGAESHGSFVSEGRIKSFPPIMFEQHGIALQNALWDDTLTEFAFIDCKRFLA